MTPGDDQKNLGRPEDQELGGPGAEVAETKAEQKVVR